MSTIIDALFVTLGLDTKDLESKQPRAVGLLKQVEKAGEGTEKSVTHINKATKETSKSVDGLTRTLGSFLAVIGGTVAIKTFISDFIDANAQLDRLSKNLGIGVGDISAWSNAAEKLGGSAAGVQGTLDMLSKAQTQLMLTGESSLIPYFSALGISLAGVDGKARPVTDILLDLAERFSHMDRTTANNLGRMLGIDQGTLNLLLQGRQALELEIKRQKEQTAVTAAQAAMAQKFQTQIAGLKQQFEALGRSMFMQAAPYIETVLNLFERLGTWIQEHQQFVADFLKVMAVGLAALGVAALPISLTVVAITALGLAVALLWEDYQVWAKGGKSAFDWGAFAEGIEVATGWVKQLSTWLKEAYGWFEKMMNRGHEGDKDWFGIPQNKNKNTHIDPVTKQRVSDGSPLGNAIAKQEGFYTRGSTPNRAQRNHNPGNIKDGPFARRHGATGSDGTFAIFPDDATGRAALEALIVSPSYAGLSTEQKIAKFAPPSENNTAAYIASVKQSLGESSYASSMNGIPGAASIVANAPVSAGGGGGSVDKSVKTDINTLVVNTQATDAAGIVADIERALDYLFVSQANYGMVS